MTEVAGVAVTSSRGNYWSEDGDVLIHDRRTPIRVAVVFVVMGIVALFLSSSAWVAIIGGLMLCALFGLQALADVERVEFDRGTRTMRQRSALGLKWTDPLDRFECVQVVRGLSGRGHRQIRVNLKRAGVVRFSESREYRVATYALPDDHDKTEARAWGGRLAQFLNLPLELDL